MNIDYAIALRVLSRREAMKAVREDLKARGIRLLYVPMPEIRALTDAYLEANRARLIAQAKSIIETWPGFANLRTNARNQKPHKSITSVVQIS
jgi:hypothetical protein